MEVPACELCRRPLRRQWWLCRLLDVAVIAIGLAAAGSLLQGYKGPLKRWLVIGIVLVFLMPLALWETFFPPPFDITVCSDTVDYEFRDPDCAVEFAALNLSEPTEASEAEDGSGEGMPAS